jgi:hypothetical protein
MPTHEERRWISLYKGAMLEFDPRRLPERISLANGANKLRVAKSSHDYVAKRLGFCPALAVVALCESSSVCTDA